MPKEGKSGQFKKHMECSGSHQNLKLDSTETLLGQRPIVYKTFQKNPGLYTSLFTKNDCLLRIRSDKQRGINEKIPELYGKSVFTKERNQIEKDGNLGKNDKFSVENYENSHETENLIENQTKSNFQTLEKAVAGMRTYGPATFLCVFKRVGLRVPTATRRPGYNPKSASETEDFHAINLQNKHIFSNSSF